MGTRLFYRSSRLWQNWPSLGGQGLRERGLTQEPQGLLGLSLLGLGQLGCVLKGSLQQVGGEAGGPGDKVGQVPGGERCHALHTAVQTLQHCRCPQHYAVLQQSLGWGGRWMGR